VKFNDIILNCVFFNKSDYEFLKVLLGFFKDKDKITAILVGSCGSLIEPDYNRIFYIKEAIQGDRGFLDYENKFARRDDKLPTKSIPKLRTIEEYLLPIMEQRCISSSNFLNESDYIFDGTNLFDMETFYFFEICHHFGLNSFLCFRFVTDFVLADTKPQTRKNHLIELYNQFNNFLVKTKKDNNLLYSSKKPKKRRTKASDRKKLYTALRKHKRNLTKPNFGEIIKMGSYYNNFDVKSECLKVPIESFDNSSVIDAIKISIISQIGKLLEVDIHQNNYLNFVEKYKDIIIDTIEDNRGELME